MKQVQSKSSYTCSMTFADSKNSRNTDETVTQKTFGISETNFDGSIYNSQPIQKAIKHKNNKDRFIEQLKAYLLDHHGESIFQQVGSKIPEDIFQSDSIVPIAEPIQVVLTLDLMHMHLYDTFLGDNFVKCFYRYCGKVTDIVKDIYIDLYIKGEEHLKKN